MNVGLIVEWDNAKDRARYKRYAEFTRGGNREKYPELFKHLEGLTEKGVAKVGAWADNTGHIINFWEFDSTEVFSEVWNNLDWHRMYMELNPLVDNLRFRLLRPSVDIPEEAT
jgi:hypothetical protein